jgi:hypothetical protein
MHVEITVQVMHLSIEDAFLTVHEQSKIWFDCTSLDFFNMNTS